AQPLIVSRKNLEETNHRARALIVNSGNANAATGDAGIRAAKECAEAVASKIGCRTSEVLVSSTGVIGRPFPTEKIRNAVPALVSALGPNNIEQVARGIITTHTAPKLPSAEIAGIRPAGVANGAGMIHSDVATPVTCVMGGAAL